MTVYLIDGYNLMHRLLGQEADVASRRGDKPPPSVDLEEERRRLLDKIASYMGGTEDRAVVVFDSHTQALQKVESATKNVSVYFGSFSRSADDIIEREAYALQSGESVVVVTSDHGVQKVVFRANVTRRSSREFMNDLQAHTKKIANRRNCITMGSRIEDRIPPGTLEGLRALRESAEKTSGQSE